MSDGMTVTFDNDEIGYLEPCDPIPEKVRELEERVKVLENIIAGIETK